MIFNEVGVSYPLINLVDQGIQSALENSPYRIEFYREYFETVLFPDPVDQKRFRDFYLRKYRNRKPDVVITVGPTALQFMVEEHQKFFRGVPVVFCIPSMLPDSFIVPQDFTGVEAATEFAQTVTAALRMKPDTKRVVVVGGMAPFDRKQQAVVREQLKAFAAQLDISYLTDLTISALKERLRHLPGDTIVLMTALGQDAAGTKFTSAETGPIVVGAANVPVFSSSDRHFNHGEVGGYISSVLEEGKIAGGLTLRILKGEKPRDIAIVRNAHTYMFDWRALKRWGIKERDLPPDSIVLNRQGTLWELYKWYLIDAIALILIQSLLIFGLLWQRTQRKKVEVELAMAYDRLHLAVKAGRCVGWDWNIRTGEDRSFGDVRTLFGIPSRTLYGNAADFRRRVHPEDQEIVSKALADAAKSGQPYAGEFRVVRNDQSVRWIAAKGKFYYGSNGEPVRMLGMAVDITERKLAEDALANLSGRLIEAHEEERSRIAREIHDDYQQRLAMVAIDLEMMAEDLPDNFALPLRELWNRISELGADLHSLSHSLHSSTLERLGLIAGIQAFCDEFMDLQGLEVQFRHGQVPPDIPKDVALCLFRVVQEGLRNVKKHSGAGTATVHLASLDEVLQVSVSDCGIGFDRDPGPKTAIGLRSMEERLRLLGGKIEIYAQPMKGTRIVASLPLKCCPARQLGSTITSAISRR